MHCQRHRNRLRIAVRVLVFGLLLLWAVPPAAAEVPAEGKVIRLTVTLQSGQVVRGTITEYDEIGFTLTPEDGGAGHRLMWTALPIDAFDRYWRFLEEPEGDGEALLRLGVLLQRHRDGADAAESAFAEALAADPSLDDAVEEARGRAGRSEGPRFVGTADPEMWGELDAGLMAQSNAELLAFCERAQRELAIGLDVYESPRFIVCTDMLGEDVARWGEKLTEAYRTVAELLGADPDGNVFRGKCLIFVFQDRQDYIRFQLELHDTEAFDSGGLCHGYGNGFVHIACHRRLSERETTHVIVHEFVHGFVHRYRSPEHVPDWVNEGLAEYIAHRVEPPSGAGLYGRAALRLQGERGLGEGFFAEEGLQAWQYDIAGALTQYLLERSADRYPVLMNGIKDGDGWAEALDAAYRMDERRLVLRFKRRLDRALNEQLSP
jgi:hypothetical protein